MISGGVFITGTDTEVGKTWVSCAILNALKSSGRTAFALKPVAAGAQLIDGHWRNDDALALQKYASESIDYDNVNPMLLRAPVAPHIAAEWENKPFHLASLLLHCQAQLASRDGYALIEGAGGWRVPLNEQEMLSDFAVALGLPVIMVVPIRLGCLNHALLTAEAIRRDGLRLSGWVANLMRENYAPGPALIETLQNQLAAPCLGRLPLLANVTGSIPTPAEVAALTASLDVERLLTAFGAMTKQS